MLRTSLFTLSLVALPLSVVACSDDSETTEDTTGSATTGSQTTGSAATGSGTSSTGNQSTGAGGATSSSSGSGGGGEGGSAPGGTLRFIALGDGGEGNATQYKVAAAVKNVCDTAGGCDFALYLGDNIYDTGASDVNDGQFQSKFEQPYMDLPFRFYVVLGNHDYGGGGSGFEFFKGQVQVDYSMTSTKWTMPSHYYTFNVPADEGPSNAPTVQLFGLDTNAVMFGQDGQQKSWIDSAIGASTATWKIAFGHHPFISNGQHGNAGEYEGIPFIPIVSGQNVEDFMTDKIRGKVDAYICGHDHNRQWLEPNGGTEFIVSGTAAKETGLVGRGTPTFFEEDADAGFLLVEITQTTFTGTFYDEDQNIEYTRTITK